MRHTSYSPCHHSLEALFWRQATCQRFCRQGNDMAVAQLQLRHHALQKRDLLLRPVEEGEAKLRSTDGQRYPRYPCSGAKVQKPRRTWQEIALQKINRFHNEDVDETLRFP